MINNEEYAAEIQQEDERNKRRSTIGSMQDINLVLWYRTRACGMAGDFDQQEVNIKRTFAVLLVKKYYGYFFNARFSFLF